MYIYRIFGRISAVFVLSYGYPTVILQLSYGKIRWRVWKAVDSYLSQLSYFQQITNRLSRASQSNHGVISGATPMQCLQKMRLTYEMNRIFLFRRIIHSFTSLPRVQRSLYLLAGGVEDLAVGGGDVERAIHHLLTGFV